MKSIWKEFLRAAGVFLLAAFMLNPIAAEAADNSGALNVDSEAVLTLTLQENGNAVQGAEFSIYRVEKLDDAGNYSSVVPGISGSLISADMSSFDMSSAADTYRTAVDQNQIAASQTATTGTDGTCTFTPFSSDQFGVYLVVETGKTGTAEQYSTTEPFLITLPKWENGGWKYQVDASPKIHVNEKSVFSIRAAKFDENGNYLKGAVLAVYEAVSQKQIARWTTGAEDYVLNLEPGSYRLEEVKTPDDTKYEKASPIEFTVNTQGNVLIDGKMQEDARLVMIDRIKPVETVTTHKTVNNTNTKAASVVKTGDTSMLWLWAFLLIASGICILTIARYKHNK